MIRPTNFMMALLLIPIFLGSVMIGTTIGIAIGWAIVGPPDPSSRLGQLFHVTTPD